MVLGSNTSGHLFDTTFTADGVLYADASGVITSTAAGTSGQVLTSNGAGVAPTYQPSSAGSTVNFQAYLTSPSTFTAGSTTNNIIFDTAISNVGSGYNTGTGIFTAPSTGFYAFTCVCYFFGLTGAVGATQTILGYTGSIQSLRLLQEGIGAAVTSDVIILNASWSMPMTAGDQVKMKPFVDGAGTYDIFGAALSSADFNTASTFSGCLIN